MAKPPHEVLGVPENATRAEIDEAYRTRLIYANPKSFAEGTPERARALKSYEELVQAYDILRSSVASHQPAITTKSTPKKKKPLIYAALSIVLLFGLSIGYLFMRSDKNDLASTASVGGRGTVKVSDVAKRILPSTVLVSVELSNKDWVSGSGFFVNDKGDILTNYHVIEDASAITIMTNNKNTYTADIRAYDIRADVALLSSSTPPAESIPLVITEALPSVGEDIVVVGSPHKEFQSVSNGIVAGIRDKGGITVIQITAPISPGSSGGPVTNMRSEVVGITTSMRAGAQNINFAVSSKHLASFVVYAKDMPPMRIAKKSGPRGRRAPLYDEGEVEISLPDGHGFMELPWSCSAEDLRKRVPGLRLSAYPDNFNFVIYTTDQTFKVSRARIPVYVFYYFYDGALMMISFIVIDESGGLRQKFLSLRKELIAAYGRPTSGHKNSASGGHTLSWVRDDILVNLIPLENNPNSFAVDFTSPPVFREFLERIADQKGQRAGVIIVDRATCRNGPSITARAVGWPSKGTVVTIHDERYSVTDNRTWLFVTYQGSQGERFGWISDALIEIID